MKDLCLRPYVDRIIAIPSIRSTPVLDLSSLSASMHSPALKPISIALSPSADRSTLIPNPHQQQHYLSPPLTPFLKHLSTEDQPKPPNSQQSYFPPSLPAIREMLPPERRPDTVPTVLENHVLPGSASERRSQLEFTETLGAIPSSTAHGATSVPDPSRLQQVFTSQSVNGIPPSSSMLSPLLRRNKAHVASACVNCKKAHLACDGTSPCLLVPRTSLPSIYGGSHLGVCRSCNRTPIMHGLAVIRAAPAECGCMSSGSCAPPSVRDIILCVCASGIEDCVFGGRAPVSGNGVGNYFSS